MANDGRLEPGMPSAGTSCDHDSKKLTRRGEKRNINKTVINKRRNKKERTIIQH